MNANEPNDPNQGPVESTQVVPAADERAAFENWASDSGQWPKAIQRNVDGYLLAITQAFWSAWMARAALAVEPVKPQEPAALPPGFDRASLMDLADWLAEHDKTINPTPPRAGTMTSLAYAEADGAKLMSDLAVALFGVICAFLGFLVGVGFTCERFKTGKWSYDEEEHRS